MNHLALALLVAPREGGSGTMIFVLQLVAIFAIFWFLLIRPQKKEQERHQQMIQSLKKGDEVVTAGGIVGKVIHAKEDRLIIRTADDTKLEVQRGRVSQKLGPETAGDA